MSRAGDALSPLTEQQRQHLESLPHGLWAASLLVLVARGPGRLSLDRLLGLDGGAGRR